ncbi:ABC transporter ATP-binding protein [Billgrantia kenyensis]|uniref:ABC transporter ATP-binding protein n=1 Tax=Billgrantia kenyensis TaxID=321266 RepID=A0A7V9W0A4_9GAMM|nr:ABC transporter ATP-binding protein [Halomonas kenyensis]MBA2778681.1 ABC transporter ATP-binding protein [Halomonas kenyensis]MCG6661743.1 ABC transporter ATP-binding protein [Halomonas kenyensis]
MLTSLLELYRLLTHEQRRKLLKLQILVVVMALLEILGVMSIGPFMAMVGDISLLEGEGVMAGIYQWSGMATPEAFLFWAGVVVLVCLITAALVSMYTVWRLCLFGSLIGAELSSRLYRYYVHQDWLYHASGSSNQLTNKIAQECRRVTDNIINPVLQLNARAMMALFMMAAIFIYNPWVAIIGISIFLASYVVLYRTVRQRLRKNGQVISAVEGMRYKLMAEGFGGVKDMLLLGRQRIFVERFNDQSRRFAWAVGTNQVMARVPRYMMELVAFGSVIFLVLYLLKSHQSNLGAILPVLSVYALAGFKLLPAFQEIYSGISNIRSNVAAFESIRDDLAASVDEKLLLGEANCDSKRLIPEETLVLKDITFRYPGKVEPALNGLTLTIPARKTIGLVGPSGSGKSTTIDLLLGLIEPNEGELLIDGTPLQPEQKRQWQNALGLVPQFIFLADASIRENIAFGLPSEQVNEEKVRRAADMAHLGELLDQLPQGLDTRVGERGVQLSGGQRQRIGIARALYHDADLLVLDEATSALDGITEQLIMDAINDFSGNKTIVIIAHRLATVRKCDRIYLMENGQVIDQGSYDELNTRNLMFRRMVQNA